MSGANSRMDAGAENTFRQLGDNRHLFTFSGTYALPKNWDIGAKLRAVGGAPYTPYDVEKVAWSKLGRQRQSLLRLQLLQQRTVKTFHPTGYPDRQDLLSEKVHVGGYIDIQNILNSKYKEQDVYIKTGKILNPDAPLDQQRYELKPVERRTGTLLPSIGLMIEF